MERFFAGPYTDLMTSNARESDAIKIMCTQLMLYPLISSGSGRRLRPDGAALRLVHLLRNAGRADGAANEA